MSFKYTWSCYCGSVQVGVKKDANVLSSGMCCCTSCQKSHGAILYMATYWNNDDCEIVKGKELIQGYYHAAPQMVEEKGFGRFWCTKCGARIFAKMPGTHRKEKPVDVMMSVYHSQCDQQAEIWADEKCRADSCHELENQKCAWLKEAIEKVVTK